MIKGGDRHDNEEKLKQSDRERNEVFTVRRDRSRKSHPLVLQLDDLTDLKNLVSPTITSVHT